MSIENSHSSPERKNNELENSNENKLLNFEALENRINNDIKIDEKVLKEVEGLGGTKEVLMSKLAGVKEKMKQVTEKVRLNARRFALLTGLGLSVAALERISVNREHHNQLTIENSDPSMVKERAGAYVKGKSEWLAEHISPFGYSPFVSIENKNEGHLGSSLKDREKDRYDAWYLYLGLEQENNTFEVSPFRPSNSKDSSVIYYRIPQHEASILRRGLFALKNQGLEKIELVHNRGTNFTEYVDKETSDKIKVKNNNLNPFDDINYREAIKDKGLQSVVDSFKRYWPKDNVGVMGRYTVSKGKDNRGDYLSYYDKWDLHPGGILSKKEASEVAGVGKPFEIYGRIYYDPKTGEIIKETK